MSLHFDVTGDNSNFLRKLEETKRGVAETAKFMESQGKIIDSAFNKISLGTLEKFREIMSELPNNAKELEPFKRQIADLEKRIEEATKRIIELQNQAKQPTVVNTNTGNIKQESSAYESLLESIKDVLGARGSNVAAMLQEQNAIRLNQRELKVLEGIESRGLKLSEAQQTRRIQLVNSISEHKQAVASLRQVISNEIKLEQAATTSMDSMSQSLGRMRMAYRQLSEQERSSKFGLELQKNIQEADNQIKQLDASIGNHQRNVGNYKSQWNGLSMSIHQVAREMPSLAYGPKVFFSAISNNLPILADEIKRAKNEFKALKAEGKDATPVWKQVATSLFSWNTALTVGITLLTLYGDKIVDWVAGLFDAKDAVKDLVSAELEMALARKKAISDSTKERTELDLLYNKLKSTTVLTEERNSAVGEWMKKYPQHSNIMNGELVSLGKLEFAYQSLSKQIIEAAKARAYADKITELETKKNDTLTKRQNQYVTYLKAIEEQNKAVDEYSQKEKTGFGTATAKIAAKDKIFRAEQNVIDQKKAWEDLIKETRAYDESISIISQKIKVDDLFPQPKEGTYDYWQQQVQIADTALKQIDSKQKELMDAGKFDGIDASVVANYKAQSKLLKEAQNELKIYDTTGKYDKQQESAAEKLRKQNEKLKELSSKQSIEQERAEEDLQNQVDQARIDARKDGSTKTIAQMQLNHKKEMQQFEREKEDKLRKAIEDARAIFDAEEDAKKAEKPKYEKKTFDASGVKLSDSDTRQYDTQKGFIGEKQNRETEEYYKSLRDSYQDYTDQRIAIEEKFNADIATLQEARKKYDQEGNTEKVQQTDRAIAQATKGKGQGLMQLDYDKLKESPEYVRAFENLKQTSSETLNSLLSQLENAKHTAAKVLSPDQLREYTTTIQEIMDELDSRNPWQALSDKKQELADAEQELAQAQIELENARQTAETVKGGGKVEYTTTKFNQKTGKIDSTKAYLTEAQALDNVKDKTDRYNKSKDNVVEKSAKVKKAEKEVTEQIDELSKTISDLGSVIGGSAGEIIGLIGNIGSFTMMAMTGVEAAADTSAQAISTVEKASVILAIIGAAVQIATKIFDLFGKDTTTEKYEDAKEAYESYINILDRVIEKQLELAESLSGDNANAAYEKAIEAIKEQSRNAKVLGQQYLNSGASGKSHSKGYNEVEDMSWEGWNQAAQALGMSVDQFKNKMGGRMTGLFDLTDEQLVKLQDKAGIFWSQLDSDTQDYANQVADGVAKVAEVMEQRMADVTLLDVDSLRSDFQDLLTDMDADSADFAGNFEEYMKNAIINSMIKEEYMGKLESWRKKFYNAMAGGVTEEEYNALKAEGQQLSDEMKAEQEAMKEMYGWTSGESTSQNSTKGMSQSMSQDTGNELNGRFTAFQISNEEIKNAMLSMLISVNLISVSVSSNSITLIEIRNIMISSNSYLEDIAKYTKELIGLKQTIANIENSAKAMAGK